MATPKYDDALNPIGEAIHEVWQRLQLMQDWFESPAVRAASPALHALWREVAVHSLSGDLAAAAAALEQFIHAALPAELARLRQELGAWLAEARDRLTALGGDATPLAQACERFAQGCPAAWIAGCHAVCAFHAHGRGHDEDAMLHWSRAFGWLEEERSALVWMEGRVALARLLATHHARLNNFATAYAMQEQAWVMDRGLRERLGTPAKPARPARRVAAPRAA